MFKLIDRLLILSYVKAYFICFVSLIGLYVVVDLFTHMDDFTQKQTDFVEVTTNIAQFYAYRIIQIFDRLCEMIVLLAAMFTIAWVQRNNELLPLLSAGVSTRRVLLPVLVSATGFLGLSVLNQELVIPRIAQALMRSHDDPDGDKDQYASGAFEPNGILITGETATRRGLIVRKFNCVIPPNLGPGTQIFLEAKEAHYVPLDPESPDTTGGWVLHNTKPAYLENWSSPEILKELEPGSYFLRTTEIDFDVLTRDRKWFYLASTTRIIQELNKPEAQRLASMAVVFHGRLTRPILGMILLFLGLSVILRDQNRNVFISAGLCIIMCAVFFGVQFGCKQLGDNEVLAPALAAWLPVLIFGPLAFVLFDAIHT